MTSPGLKHSHRHTSMAAVAVGALLIWGRVATAQVVPPPLDPALVEEGRRIFNEETFDGNGRTCASCHPAQNNFTLSPAFVASLPADDPLFVAEFDPALAQLENPALMRGPQVLILENIDGFDKPPMFRGTPHIFDSALTAPFGLSSQVPNLRAFCAGAVMQHFPKTLNRIPGVDFRVPTEFELEALEAYQLSVFGRRDFNYDLNQLVKTPQEQRGKDLFFGKGKCFMCHNGPALGGGGFNGITQFNVGITRLPESTIPPVQCPECGPLGVREAGGNRLFDVPPLFGIPGTGPYFHDNSRPTLRRSVDFYDSPFFNQSPAAQIVGPIDMVPVEMDDLAGFLGVLTTCGNADDNVNDPPCENAIQSATCPLAATGDDGQLTGNSATYPPALASQVNTTSSNFLVRRDFSTATGFRVVNGLLRFNTAACLPPNATVVTARLRMVVQSKSDANDRNLVGDWFNWGPTIDLSDFSPTAQTTALSPLGNCGQDCDVTRLNGNAVSDFWLDNVGNVNAGGFTHLRLHIDGDAPAGQNGITFVAFDHPTLPEPLLIVEYTTGGPVPTATVNAPTRTPTSTPTATSTPTVTPPPAAPTSTATAANTATSTNTPLPTNTPIPTSTATAPPTSTATIAGALPDLIETSVSNPPVTIVRGGSFSVTDTTRNQGTATAGATLTRYVLSPVSQHIPPNWLLGNGRNVPSLAPGGESSGSRVVNTPNTMTPGTYYLLACADRNGTTNGAVLESDENNNCVASATTVAVTAS